MVDDNIFGEADPTDLQTSVANLEKQVEKMFAMIETMAKAIKKDEYPYPPAPKTSQKSDEEFAKLEGEKKTLEEKVSSFEKEKESFEATKKELETFKTKEHDEKVNEIVAKQFSKGLITEEQKVETAGKLKDFSDEALDAVSETVEKVNEAPPAGPAGDKGGEAGTEDKKKEEKIKALEEKIEDFENSGLETSAADLRKELKELKGDTNE